MYRLRRTWINPSLHNTSRIHEQKNVYSKLTCTTSLIEDLNFKQNKVKLRRYLEDLIVEPIACMRSIHLKTQPVGAIKIRFKMADWDENRHFAETCANVGGSRPVAWSYPSHHLHLLFPIKRSIWCPDYFQLRPFVVPSQFQENFHMPYFHPTIAFNVISGFPKLIQKRICPSPTSLQDAFFVYWIHNVTLHETKNPFKKLTWTNPDFFSCDLRLMCYKFPTASIGALRVKLPFEIVSFAEMR